MCRGAIIKAHAHNDNKLQYLVVVAKQVYVMVGFMSWLLIYELVAKQVYELVAKQVYKLVAKQVYVLVAKHA